MRRALASLTALAAAASLSGCSVSLLPRSLEGQGPAAHRGLPPVQTPGSYRPQAAPRPGGTITVGMFQFPSTLSPYFGAQAPAAPIDQALFDGLVTTTPDLQWYGDLAQEVPTVGNGGVRVTGSRMDVTYRLRPGLAWSDGQPITADDVVFTYQVITGAGAAAGVGQLGYDRVSGVDAGGQDTVVVHFRSLYPAYRSLFTTILPRHRLQGVAPAQLAGDPYWTRPDVVSGPFTVAELAADHVTLQRNPHYADGRRDMGILGHAAYADRVIFQALESRQAVLAALKAGDVQAGLGLTERELPTIGRMTGVRVVLAPSLSYEQLSLNQSDPNPATGGVPPWVDDPAVAEALDLAMDRPTLRSRLGAGLQLTATPISPQLAWAYDPGIGVPAYDLARARRLLDQDGWTTGADGIRVKNGRRLAFTLSTTNDQQVRIAEEEVLAAGWQKLGADVSIQDFSEQQLFGSYDQGGVLSRGGYEAAIWSWVTPVDPDVEFDILHSSALPAHGRPDGQNYSRCHDAAIDQALAGGRATLDDAERGAAYRAFQAAYVQARCELPLYRRLDIGVTARRLHNFVPNPAPVGNTWNLADWWLG